MRTVSDARARSGWEIYANPMTIGFWSVHVLAIAGVVALGWSWAGLGLAAVLYGVRMFFVTAGYHRYFSHRSYRTSRAMQLLLAIGAQATLQKGVLWWAAHHRRHHRASDTADDVHSARMGGFWWSHMGWILSNDFDETDLAAVKDLAKYPELRWLDRYWAVPALAVAVVLVLVGGWHALVWGFFVSQVLTWHGTFTINSLAHVWGSRRFETTDDSRNNLVLALLTFGEGWHNNHHRYQGAVRQGHRWWEIDLSFYLLRALAALRLVWDLRAVPARGRGIVAS